MGSAEGRSPGACPEPAEGPVRRGRMRVSLRYKFFPPSCQEGGQGDGRSPEADPHPASIVCSMGVGASCS